MKNILFVFIFISIWLNELLSQPKLLKDIYQFSSSKSFNPEQMLIGNTLYFIAKSKDEGNELWATDGTSANTRLVKNISLSKIDDGDPHQLTNFNNSLFFTAYHEDSGRELWTSDGSESGTTLVKDIFIGPSGSFLSNELGSFVEYQGQLYFGASGSFIIDRELFVSDGTNQGTKIVADFLQSGGLNPVNIIIFKNKLFFSGISESGFGTQLMSYDKVTNQITTIKKISPNGSSVSDLIGAKDYFLFLASDATYGKEIYVSDGTANGTKLLKDLNPGTASSTVSFYSAIANKVFFCLNGILYVTDGTANGTTNLNFNCPTASIVNVGEFYFAATNPTNNLGVELYKSDGTLNGTSLIKDINTGVASSSPGNFTFIKNKLYFSATTPNAGMELWESNGTEIGTRLLGEIRPGVDGSNISRMIAINENLIFMYANDGLTGDEPWIYEIPKTKVHEEYQTSFQLQDFPDHWMLLPDGKSDFKGVVDIRILDLRGRIILEQKFQNQEFVNGVRINKPILNGLYLVSLESLGVTGMIKALVVN
jgi:ELWxxDGT repeat protein